MLTNSAEDYLDTEVSDYIGSGCKKTDTDHRTGGNGHRFPHAKTSFEATGAG